MMNKGLMFSIMAFFLGMLIVSISFVANLNIQESEALLEHTSSSQKTFAIFENVEENIFEILENIAGIKFTVNDTNVSFVETLPEKQKKNSFDASLENYKKFALAQLKEVDLNINDETIDLSILQISPYDINYMHSNIPGKGWRQNSDIFIVPKQINFSGYFAVITLENQTYQSVSTDFKACTGQCSKGISFDLNVLNASRIQQASASHSNLDPFKTSSVTIKTSGNAQNDIIITIGSSGQMRIENRNSVPIEVDSGVKFGGGAGESPSVKLPENLVSAADRITGFSKNN